MIRCRTATSLLFLAAISSKGATAQTTDLASLRQAVVQAGGRVIVTLKSTRGAAIRAPGSPLIAPDEMDAIQSRIETSYPVQMNTRVPLIGALVLTVSDTELSRLLADPNVAAIEPDVKTYLLPSASSSARPTQIRPDAIPWGITAVGAPSAWAAGITGAGTKVGIIDTGIDYTHPDLSVVGGYDFVSSSSAPSAYADNVASCDGHGTHVAGTVAAKQNGTGVVGVAPNASLYALKVFTDYGSGCFAFLSSQFLAMQWAATNGLDVVNISIGNSNTPSWASAIAQANAAGVVIVAAAGNGGGPGITFPAAITGAIAVAALNGDNTVAGFSSSGPEMWVAAPGVGITSTLPGGGYGDKSGTSMATPHVTGLVALIRQAHPTFTADQVRNELKADAIDVSTPGFDNFSGWGLAQSPPSGASPLSIAVSPAARSISVQQGNAATGDNATVTLSGTNSASTAWSATKKKAWLTLTIASGTGSGTVAWTRNATGLTAGTYVDTITVTAASLTATVYDTLKITAAVVPVTVALSPAARTASVQQGNAAPSDNATVTLSGTNAASTAWSATKKKAWLTLTTASGTGSGTVAWSRNAIGLAVGTYVDTITVTAASSSAVVFDTLKITAAVVPVTVALSPAARSTSVQQGTAAPSDNATATLSGTNAASTAWSAVKKTAWLTLTTASGTGSGTVAWSRNSSGLAVGVYVDTVTVTAASSSAVVYDTLKITTTIVPVTVAVSPAARTVSVQQGSVAPTDNATVTLSGSNASSTAWTATKRHGWLTLTTASGTGSGTVAWSRNATGIGVGTYVDTITVTAASASAVVYDTLKITSAPVPVTVAVSPAARVVSVQQGNAAPGDNALVTLSGTNASSTAWSVTKKKAWLTLTTASGTGSGTVTWSRNAAGLAAGTYVDTLTVTAANASAVVYDTLKVTTVASAQVALDVSPMSRKVSVVQGSAAPGDSMTVTLTGPGAGAVIWWAVKRQPWLVLSNASGTGGGSLMWTRHASTLAVGTYVDTITVSSGSTPSVTVYDTLTITAAVAPIVVAVSPSARSVSLPQGSAAPSDNATVTLTGTGAASTNWVATNRKSWTALTAANGTGSGTLSWARNAGAMGAGTYVDTITVAAGSATATVIDTIGLLPSRFRPHCRCRQARAAFLLHKEVLHPVTTRR